MGHREPSGSVVSNGLGIVAPLHDLIDGGDVVSDPRRRGLAHDLAGPILRPQHPVLLFVQDEHGRIIEVNLTLEVVGLCWPLAWGGGWVAPMRTGYAPARITLGFDVDVDLRIRTELHGELAIGRLEAGFSEHRKIWLTVPRIIVQ